MEIMRRKQRKQRKPKKRVHASMHDMYMHKNWPKNKSIRRKKINLLAMTGKIISGTVMSILYIAAIIAANILMIVSVLFGIYLIGCLKAIIYGRLYTTTYRHALDDGTNIVGTMIVLFSVLGVMITAVVLIIKYIVEPYKAYKERKHNELVADIMQIHC